MIARHYPPLSGCGGIQRAALRRPMDAELVAPIDLCLRFKVSKQSDFSASMTLAHGTKDVLHLRPAVRYRAATAEMCTADGLFVLQSVECNDHSSGKVYKYVWPNKPTLERCGSVSNTAAGPDVVGFGKAHCKHLAALKSSENIGKALFKFLADICNGLLSAINREFVEAASRLFNSGNFPHSRTALPTEHLL